MSAELHGFNVLRRELNSHGIPFETESVNPKEIDGVAEELGLPWQLVELYVESSPIPNSSIPWIVEELSIFSIRLLLGAQDGYRWTGPQRERLETWPTNWVTIASVFGDPFIVDVGDPGIPVYFARHGTGAWNASRISPNLTDFIEALTRFESVLIGDYGRDVWDEDGLRHDYLRTLEENLCEILPSEELTNFLNALD